MKYVHKVNYYETDKMGVTHHSNYFRFMEEARVDFMEKLGWGYDKFEEEGIGSPVMSIEGDYRKSTTYPDIINIETCILKLSRFKIIIGYKMFVNEQIVFTGSSTHCFLSSEGPVSMEKKYPEFYEKLKEYLVPEEK